MSSLSVVKDFFNSDLNSPVSRSIDRSPRFVDSCALKSYAEAFKNRSADSDQGTFKSWFQFSSVTAKPTINMEPEEQMT
jgi:hypothetical protein